MQQVSNEVRAGELKEIVEFFRGKPVTNDALKAFCDRKKFMPILVGEYEDYLFQYEHDLRLATALPEILALLTKFRIVPELEKESVKKKIIKDNDDLSAEVAGVLENHGIVYREVDLLTRHIGGALDKIMQLANTRASNMCSAVMVDLAEEKFGKVLTIKAFAEAYRAKHGIKEEKSLPSASGEVA